MRKLLLVCLLIPFGFSLAYGQSWVWGIEGGGAAEGFAGATDNKGNAFVGGQFQRKINFNTDTLKSLLVDLYFAKYDKNGNFLWAVQSHCSSDPLSEASAIGAATDKSGNVYVTGAIRDTVYLGANRLTTPALEGATFLAKYGVNGNLIWVKQAYAPTFTTWGSGLGVVCDKLNNVYVTGGFGDTLIFGTDTLKTPDHSAGFFLVKYDSNGKQLFARQSIVPAPRIGGYTFSASVDNQNNVYLTGYFQDSIYIGSYKLKGTAQNDFFICKYDSTGNLIWAKQGLKNSVYNNAIGNSIATDEFGNSYITGQFTDTLLCDTVKLVSSIATLFVAKYDKNGHALWAKKATSLYGRQMFGFSIAASDYGKVYVSGSSGGNDSAKIQIENFIFQQKNITDGSIVLELDTAGNVLCGSIAGTGGDDENIIACDPSGQYVYLCGDGDPAIFGSDTLLGSEAPLIACWQPCDVNNTASAGSFYYPTESISVFPNPSNGKFTIQANGSQPMANSFIEIYNVLGERVYSNSYQPTANGYQLSLSNQPNGVYLYRVISQDGSLIGSGKVIIEK